MRSLDLLSVVVPCFNEQEVIRSSHERLKQVLDGLKAGAQCREYELLYVDDGSGDRTLALLKEIFATDRHVRIIALRRNSGLQAALTAGIEHAAGDAVVTIDADLQDPPEKIADMIRYYHQGYPLVLGVRADRDTDTLAKKFFAENYYRMMKCLGVEIVHNHGDYRLMDRALVEDFKKFPERCRFVRALILRLESHYAIVPYAREARKAGKTKFTPGVMLAFSLDGVVSFSSAPLRISSFCGFWMCLLALAGIGWVLYVKAMGLVVPGWSSTLIPLFGIGGIQLLMLGILGEYIGRLFVEVKQRPVYLVREEIRH